MGIGQFCVLQWLYPSCSQLVAGAWQHWRILNFLLSLPCCFDKASNVLQMLQLCGIILHVSNKGYIFLNVFTGSLQVALLLRVVLGSEAGCSKWQMFLSSDCQVFLTATFFLFFFFPYSTFKREVWSSKMFFFSFFFFFKSEMQFLTDFSGDKASLRGDNPALCSSHAAKKWCQHHGASNGFLSHVLDQYSEISCI